jgi:hypothetical protein
MLDARDMRRVAITPPSYVFTASDAPLRFRDVGRTFVGDVLTSVEHVDVEGFGHAA